MRHVDVVGWHAMSACYAGRPVERALSFPDFACHPPIVSVSPFLCVYVDKVSHGQSRRGTGSGSPYKTFELPTSLLNS